MKLWKRSLPAATLLACATLACATHDEATADPPRPPAPGATIDASVATDASEDAPVAAGPTGCSADGLCYVNVPAQAPLVAVSASSADDAWMFSEQSGSLLRWDGTDVKVAYRYGGDSPASIVFSAIWAQAKDHVWAAANGDGNLALVRYAPPVGGGEAAFRELMTKESFTMPVVLWGTEGGDALWIVLGRSVLRVHEDASGLVVEHMDPEAGAEDEASYQWHGVWGFGADDVYVAGSDCAASCDPRTNHGIVAHYDGSTWSIVTLDATVELLSLRGTPPGAERQLWVHGPEVDDRAAEQVHTALKTYLLPVTALGQVGAPVFRHALDDEPACSSRTGFASGPASGWFSDGLLLCRWTGTAFEPANTIVRGRPIIDTVSGIWADGEDAWIVGKAIARTNLPPGPFAARRTATTAKGAQP